MKAVKRATGIILVLLMCMSVITLVPAVTRAEISGDYKYIVNEDQTAMIAEYTGSDTSVTVPGEIDGHIVTSIHDYAFSYCSSLQSITIPESVTQIGISLFSGCTSLKSIQVSEKNPVYDSRENCNAIIETASNTLIQGCMNAFIPNGVLSIGAYAFSGCSSFREILIPESVTSIGEGAFYGCNNLQSVTVPKNVTSIGNKAFGGCSSMTSISLPDSLMTIGSGVFERCTGLTEIAIPDNVTSIGEGAFSKCSSLQNITLPEGLTSLPRELFFQCSGLTSITIPESVTSIEYDAFYNCSSLNSIRIPKGVMSIKSRAFENCSSLQSITISESVEQIGSGVFGGCTSLESIQVSEENPVYDSRENCNAIIETASNTLIQGCMNAFIPNGVLSIGAYAFSGCSSFREIPIPESVTSIGDGAFENCSNLMSVTLPERITDIGNRTFKNCGSLKSITFPKGIECIGDLAFSGCSSLTGVILPGQLTDLGMWAFSGCSSLQSITIPESLTSLSNYVFSDCTGLTDAVLPASLTSIGMWAFSGCSSLQNITIPEGVTEIGMRAFRNCSSLTSFVFPGGITSIEEGLLYGCSSLKSIVITEGVQSIDQIVFFNCTSLSSVIIPESVTTINKDCLLGITYGKGVYKPVPGFVIYGKSGSAAETYAKEKGITFSSGHQHSLQYKAAVAATCTGPGNREHWYCTECGKYFSDSTGKTELTRDNVIIPATGHDWGEWIVDKAPTVLESGSRYHVCRNNTSHVEREVYPFYWKTEGVNYSFTGIAVGMDDIRYFLFDGVVDLACSESLWNGTMDKLQDVHYGDWYYPPVIYAVSHKNLSGTPLMKGYAGEISFGPNDPLTRGMFATILYRYENEPATDFDPYRFPDVTDIKAFFATPAIWASNVGYIKGYENGKFGAEDNITREQLAVILYRYAQAKGYDTSAKGDMILFPDADRISSWAKEALIWASGTRIITGKEKATGARYLDPQGNAARAECAAMLQRFIAYVERQQK